MAKITLLMPAWVSPRVSRQLQRQYGRGGSKSWAWAAPHFTGESASALSKRLSESAENSKYIYQLRNGKHTTFPDGPDSWIAKVDRRPGGGFATPYYYVPWELMVPVVSLDRVCHLLYASLDNGYFGTSKFFFSAVYGLPDGTAWQRNLSLISDEAEVLWGRIARNLATDSSVRERLVFDRFAAIWCLYREAILRRNLAKAIHYREAIIESHSEISRHPVFSHVFDEYRQYAMGVFKADGLPGREKINRDSVQNLRSGYDADRDLKDLGFMVGLNRLIALRERMWRERCRVARSEEEGEARSTARKSATPKRKALSSGVRSVVGGSVRHSKAN